MKWSTKAVGEVCEVVGGTTPSTSNPEYWDGGITWLSPVDLPEVGTITRITGSQRTVTERALKECSLKVLPPGSLVFSTRASIGKIGLVSQPLVTNQGFTNLIPKDDVDVVYLAYALKYFTPQIEKLGNTTTFKEVSRTAVRNFHIPVPPLAVQREIAATLDKADALRRKDQELLWKYDALAQSIFYEMFGDPTANNRGWRTSTLGEVCSSFKYGTNVKSSGEVVPGSIPVVRIPNVLDNAVDFNDLKYAVLAAKELNEVRLRKGDLLFVRTNGNPEYIGRCAVYQSSTDAAYASYLIRARLDESSEVDAQFLQSLFSLPTNRRELLRRATTTAGNYNINTQSLRSLPVIVPPIDLQRSYAAAFRQVVESKALAMQNCIASKRLMESQLHRHFN